MESTFYLPFLTGNLFLFTSIFLIWQLGSLWAHRPRTLLLPALCLFLASCAGVGFLIAFRLSQGWIITGVLTLVEVGIIVLLWQRYPAPTWLRLVSSSLAGLLVITLFITPGILGVSYLYYHRQATTTSQSNITELKNDIQTLTQQAGQQATKLAADPHVVAALSGPAASSTLLATLQDYVVRYGLDVVTVTDTNGAVLARVDYPAEQGDLLTDRLAWTSQLFSARVTSQGLGWSESGEPLALGFQPVQSSGKTVGYLLAGYQLSNHARLPVHNQFRSAVTNVYGTPESLSASATDQSFLGASDLISWIAAHPNNPNGEDFYTNTRIRVGTAQLITYDSSHPLVILTLRNESSSL